MTYIERLVATATEEYGDLTYAQLNRKATTLRGQIQKAGDALSRAEGNRRAKGGRIQSRAETKARGRRSELETRLSVIESLMAS